ncbi:MAG: aminotransferase class I/II-fold pyridoxal phosphate-dependent enzyme, partial [Acidimicrobiales bacterium]
RLIFEMLQAIDGVSCVEPKGAFYAFPNLEDLIGTRVGGVEVSSTVELAAVILDQAKVAFVPGEAFGAAGYARFSFALSDEDLVEGITRIHSLLRK